MVGELGRLLDGGTAGRVLFLPSIKEHRARLIGRTPSAVARDLDLLLEALLAEHETYGFGFLMVGMDQYNVEAEAMGCRVRYFEDSPEVPCLHEHLFARPGELARLPLPDPRRAGRMPLFLEAARRIGERVRGRALVHAAISGPFSIASEMMGTEEFLVALLLDPEGTQELLRFCTEIATGYGTAFASTGAGVSVFDAKASPDLISPQMYRERVQPLHRRLVNALQDSGVRPPVGLIIGGNTLPIAADLAATGAGWLVADYCTDQQAFLERVSGSGVLLRLNGRGLEFYSEDEATARRAIQLVRCRAADCRRCLIGTGPVPYTTPPDRVRTARRLAEADTP